MGKGGIIGRPNEPTAEVASGMWSLREHYNAVKNSIWPITATDPYFNYVTMLLQGNGTNGTQNNTFLDGSPNNFTITRNGNTTQGSLNPFGDRWSNYFPSVAATCLKYGSNTALALGSGDFTVEFWTFVNALAPSYSIFLDWRTNGNNPANIPIIGDNNNNGKLSLVATALGALLVESSSTIPLRSWTHVAVVRSGSTITMYFNGTSVGTGTSSATFGIETLNVSNPQSSGNYNPDAYISNLRIVKGTAVYTAAFTPPAAPLTAITNTSLLTCQSNRFIDNSSNNFTITRNGDVSVRPFNPFSPSAAYSTSVNGGSGYFDGTGDYLKSPSNAAFAFGTGDFTMEAWIYPTASVVTTQGVVSTRIDASGSTSQSFFGIDSGQALYYAGSLIQGGAVTLNQWTHIACSRQSNTIRVFVNGVQTATGTDTADKTTTFGYVGAGGGDNSQLFTGYITDARFVKGTAVYTAGFTPPTAPLTAITNTSLLLNFTNAGIIDSAADNVFETVGNAQISTSVKKYGTGSLAFDGSGDWLVAPSTQDVNFGTGDFTVEAWVWVDSTVNPGRPDNLKTVTVFSTGSASANDCSFAVYGNTTTPGIGLELYQASPSIAFNVAATVATNNWVHVAWVRSGTTIYGFVGGTRYTLGTTSSVIGSSTSPKVGSANTTNYTNQFKGYIDDLRITKGFARYTANFTAPTQPLPNR